MSNIDRLIGKDEAAEYLRAMRAAIGDSYPDWDEIEPILYDTFKEFEAHPDFKARFQFPGIEKLTADELTAFGKQVGELAAAYGMECRSALLVPLATARVQLWALKKYGTTGE